MFTTFDVGVFTKTEQPTSRFSYNFLHDINLHKIDYKIWKHQFIESRQNKIKQQNEQKEQLVTNTCKQIFIFVLLSFDRTGLLDSFLHKITKNWQSLRWTNKLNNLYISTSFFLSCRTNNGKQSNFNEELQ